MCVHLRNTYRKRARIHSPYKYVLRRVVFEVLTRKRNTMEGCGWRDAGIAKNTTIKSGNELNEHDKIIENILLCIKCEINMKREKRISL